MSNPREETATGRALTVDVLFLGMTRPAMRWGVTFSALLANGVFTMNVFLFTSNLLTLLICLPIHGVSVLFCARDARVFDLLALWARTGLASIVRNRRFWGGSSYSALTLDLPRPNGRRRAIEAGCWSDRASEGVARPEAVA
jgi:type IV secretion system protein VirB3